MDLTIFDDLQSKLPSLSIDEIKETLRPLTKGYSVRTPIIDPGTFLYRARKLDSKFNKSGAILYRDLIYPPPEIAKAGRLNRDKQAVFYCSTAKEPVFFELPGLQAGDEIVLTIWKTTEKMIVNNVGYTQFVFESLGAKRPCPTWHSIGDSSQITIPELQPPILLPSDDNSKITEAFGRHFAMAVAPDETQRYKLTTAIGELHLGNIGDADMQFAGVLYPSVRMSANGDNLAVLPWFVDQHLQLTKACHIRIDGRTTSSFSITTLDVARSLSSDQKLQWLGRNICWTVQPGRTAIATATAGRDEDGDYEHSVDGSPVHWEIRDSTTGQVIPIE